MKINFAIHAQKLIDDIQSVEAGIICLGPGPGEPNGASYYTWFYTQKRALSDQRRIGIGNNPQSEIDFSVAPYWIVFEHTESEVVAVNHAEDLADYLEKWFAEGLTTYTNNYLETIATDRHSSAIEATGS